jgi:hypothetical protein
VITFVVNPALRQMLCAFRSFAPTKFGALARQGVGVAVGEGVGVGVGVGVVVAVAVGVGVGVGPPLASGCG